MSFMVSLYYCNNTLLPARGVLFQKSEPYHPHNTPTPPHLTPHVQNL